MSSIPHDLGAELDPALPVVLLPIRIETRWGERDLPPPEGTGGEPAKMPVLRVRIFPDDISVVTAPDGLTPAEVEAGRRFWTTHDAEPSQQEASDEGLLAHRRRGAWEVLARTVGADRVAHVARATRSGEADRMVEPVTPAARLLPESWVVVGHSGGERVLTAHVTRPPGRDSIAVGPAGHPDGPAPFDPEDPGVVVDPELRWLTDYDAAERQGMAVTVDLVSPEEARAGRPPPWREAGLEALVVLGVRGSHADDPEQEAERLADLLGGHLAAGDAAFVPVGTPTNNLQAAASGWSSRPDIFAGYDQAVGEPAEDEEPITGALRGEPGTTATRALGAALGLPPAALAGLPASDHGGQAHARAMATALYPATFGEAMRTLLRSIAPAPAEVTALDAAAQFAAGHVTDYVRGRGPLPVLRIGRQPYGVLPVTLLARLAPAPGDPPALEALTRLLRALRPFWDGAAARLPALGGVPGESSAALMRILQQSPVPHPGQYQLRTHWAQDPVLEATLSWILGPDVQPASDLQTLAAATTTTQATPLVDAALQIVRQDDVAGVLGDATVRAQVASGAQASGIRQVLLKALWASLGLPSTLPPPATDPLFGALTTEPPSRFPAPVVSRPGPAAEGGLTAPGYLAALAAGRGIMQEPPDLLYHLTKTSLLLDRQPPDPADLVARWQDALPQFQQRLADFDGRVRQYHWWHERAAQTPITDGVVELEPPASEVRDHLENDPDDQVPWWRLPELVAVGSGPGGATKAAVQLLADAQLDDGGYARLLGETLACASTRLDAWITSLATRRLDQLRSGRPRGVQLGCWGVVTDLPGPPVRPDADAADGLQRPRRHVGYVHAPSLDQAATAGVLRAAELSHAGSPSTLASLDLTSRQARTGRDVITAVGNGQPLGAVLGDWLERALADAGLHAATTALRLAFPQDRTDPEPPEGPQAGATREPPAGSEAVIPADVVDGFDAWRAWRNDGSSIPRTAPGDPATLATVFEQLDRVVEAVADTFVAEGVHALVSGRSDLAGATFAALERGDQPPLDFDVLRTPRSGVTISHRLVLPLDGLPAVDGWNRTRPRALLAPGPERWAASVLGPPSGYRTTVSGRTASGDQVRTAVGLDALGLCALDVAVESAEDVGGARVPLLAERLAAAAGVVGDLRVEAQDGTWDEMVELAGAVAAALTGARPARAADLAPPPDGGTVGGQAGPLPAPELQDDGLVHRIADQLEGLDAALAGIDDAVRDRDDTEPVGNDLLDPLARLGLPGSVLPPGAATVGAARAAASAAAAVRRDVHQLLAEAGAPGGEVQAGDGAPEGEPPDPADAEIPWRDRLTTASRGPSGLDVLTAVVRRLAGDPVLPTPAVPSELQAHQLAGAAPSAAELDAWLERVGRVRDKAAAVDDLRLFVEAAGRTTEPLHAVHLPRVDGQPWLGGAVTEAEAAELRRPQSGYAQVHVVVAGTVPTTGDGSLSALVLDEFDEVLPAATTTTGLSFHYDAPGARPPQSILVAVHPDPDGTWSWKLLDEIVTETLALARLRPVELEDLTATGLDQLLPLTYVRTTTDQAWYYWQQPIQPMPDPEEFVTEFLTLEDQTMPADLAHFLETGELSERLLDELLGIGPPWVCPAEQRAEILEILQDKVHELLPEVPPELAPFLDQDVDLAGRLHEQPTLVDVLGGRAVVRAGTGEQAVIVGAGTGEELVSPEGAAEVVVSPEAAAEEVVGPQVVREGVDVSTDFLKANRVFVDRRWTP